MVRSPLGSTARAIWIESLVAMSELAGVTERMMLLGLAVYFSTRSRICVSMSAGWSPTGTLVMPGRSTSVRSGTWGDVMRNLMGLCEIACFFPVMRSVSSSISFLMSLKTVNLFFGQCRNSPHSSHSPPPTLPRYVCSCRMRGARVTMPEPRGRKSFPTMLSSTLLLPLLWLPTTTICGSSTALPRSAMLAITSCSLLMAGRSLPSPACAAPRPPRASTTSSSE
mmetsp:Transcript_11015/g.21820  ORF Transcript_11015/g.21820 Transcript_11015/m.21820 type:complete len:224 (+) Transcript_11015:955-1626(+)